MKHLYFKVAVEFQGEFWVNYGLFNNYISALRCVWFEYKVIETPHRSDDRSAHSDPDVWPRAPFTRMSWHQQQRHSNQRSASCSYTGGHTVFIVSSILTEFKCNHIVWFGAGKYELDNRKQTCCLVEIHKKKFYCTKKAVSLAVHFCTLFTP